MAILVVCAGWWQIAESRHSERADPRSAAAMQMGSRRVRMGVVVWRECKMTWIESQG